MKQKDIDLMASIYREMLETLEAEWVEIMGDPARADFYHPTRKRYLDLRRAIAMTGEEFWRIGVQFNTEEWLKKCGYFK